jgi:hypothetical protein
MGKAEIVNPRIGKNYYDRDKYYEGRCNRLHDLFIHYSTVRMTILSFLIPLGGIVVVSPGKVAAGLWLMGIAYIMNLFFGAKSIDRWLKHKNIDLWLYSADIKCKAYIQMYTPSSWRGYVSFLFSSPKWELSHDEIRALGYEQTWISKWEADWKAIVSRARSTEWTLQLLVAFGLVVYIVLLFK